MSLGAGMAVGMGAGMGAGIGVGIAAGQNSARSKIVAHAQSQGATLQDASGKPLDWDEFLDEALVPWNSGGKGMGVALAVLGALIFVGLGLTFFLLLR
jgi:hypothetical protein